MAVLHEKESTYIVLYDANGAGLEFIDSSNSNIINMNKEHIRNFLVKDISETNLNIMLEKLLNENKISGYTFFEVKCNML